MNQRRVPDPRAYERVVGVFKKHKNGITLADVSADTGFPLEQVKNLVPIAADEYSARLEVTESSEILYSFPNGFTSRYRGPGPALKRFLSSFLRVGAAALKLLFKAWIMVMLLGYFLLFMAIALASLFISVSANSRSSNRRGGRGGFNVSLGIFDLIFRLWFYSELFGSPRRRYNSTGWIRGRDSGAQPSEKGHPLHKAVFSFVFGEDDPNRDWETRGKKAFISYLRKQQGVVSLPELMIISALPSPRAESLITSLCAEFGGSPEVTEEGTVIYRFDEILLSAELKNSELSSGNLPAGKFPATLYKKLKVFSSNPKKMNTWFSIINGVNLLFGTYFLYNTVNIGRILSEAALPGTGIYGMVYYTLGGFLQDPFPVIRIALGVVPLLFSAFFWLIPAIRSMLVKKENGSLRLDNFRGLGYGKIWANPSEFRPDSFTPPEDECRPGNLKAARNILVKEMGAYSTPEVSIDEKQNEVFSFPELGREKDALEKYRLSVDPRRSETGKTIFDSGA